MLLLEVFVTQVTCCLKYSSFEVYLSIKVGSDIIIIYCAVGISTIKQLIRFCYLKAL